MPKLADMLAERNVGHVDKTRCPRCPEQRAATIYVQGRAMRNITEGEGLTPSHRTSRAFKSTSGVKLCRVCASEVIGQIAQLLGTEVRDGEAD